MNNPTNIARNVRADITRAIDNGTLTVPDSVAIAVRTDRRGLAPTISVDFRPAGRADDDGTDYLDACVDAWKYTALQDGTRALSDDVKTAGSTIIQMIKKRSDGSCYGEINCNGTIIAVLIPR